MELSRGLHRVGNDLVACYLVADERGVTVIDAGLSGQWDEFVAELEVMGRSITDVRALLLTHGDEDHIGFAERLRSDHGVPVWVHHADAGRARGEGKPSTGWGRFRLGPLLGFLWYTARKGGLKTSYLKEVRTLSGGEVMDLPGSPVIIPMPGHSPGSVAVHVPAVRAVFVGDALTTRNVLTGVAGPGPAPFTDDAPAAAAAWSNLYSLDVDWVLPGHGAPWRGGARGLGPALPVPGGEGRR